MTNSKIRTLDSAALADLAAEYRAAKAEMDAAKERTAAAKDALTAAVEPEMERDEGSVYVALDEETRLTVTRKEEIPALSGPVAGTLATLAKTRAKMLIDIKTTVTRRVKRENVELFLAEDHTAHPRLAKAQGLLREVLSLKRIAWSVRESGIKDAKKVA